MVLAFGNDAERNPAMTPEKGHTMRVPPRTASAIALGSVVLATALTAGSAQATTAATTQPRTASASGNHCWYEMGSDRSMCAETPDALAVKMYTTYGVVLDERPGEHLPDQVMAPSEKVKQLVKSGRLARSAGDGAQPMGSTFLLIKGYSEKNYGGYSVNWTQALSERPCRLAASYPYGQIEYMHNYNFNDKMRSYQVASGCRLNVYKDTVFRGNIRGPSGNSTSLGILDREVSSMSLRY
jgi:hypothetical protein